MKSCWICKHLEFSPGERDWSEITPGSDPDVTCSKTDRGGWRSNKLFGFFDDDCKIKAMEIAKSCEFYDESKGVINLYAGENK